MGGWCGIQYLLYLQVDVAYQYLRFFCEDDEKVPQSGRENKPNLAVYRTHLPTFTTRTPSIYHTNPQHLPHESPALPHESPASTNPAPNIYHPRPQYLRLSTTMSIVNTYYVLTHVNQR